MIKTLALSLTFFTLIASVEAKGTPKMSEKDKQEQKEKEEKKAKNEKMRAAVKELLSQKDKNKDGALSKDEFLNGEADPADAAKRFDQFNKNGSRDLEKTEIESLLGF